MNQDKHAACEDWGELVSALLDQELTSDERASTEAHLATCAPCRQLASALERVDNLVRTPVHVAPSCTMPLWTCDHAGRADRRHAGRRGRWSRLASVGTAAALLLGLVGTVRWMQTSPSTDVVRPVARTLDRLSAISQQQRRTQEMTRETLQWELRTLKLELDQLQLTPDESRRLRGRLTELIRQLEIPSVELNARNRSGRT